MVDSEKLARGTFERRGVFTDISLDYQASGLRNINIGLGKSGRVHIFFSEFSPGRGPGRQPAHYSGMFFANRYLSDPGASQSVI
jgi:hypothetical protein